MAAALLNLAQRREVAGRYRAGESMPALAEAFGVRVQVIQSALIKERVPRRSPREARLLVHDSLRECRHCGRNVDKNALKLLCPVCAKRFCQSCDEKLPEHWRARLCSTCKRVSRYRNRPMRVCRICGRMGAGGSKRDLCNVHLKLYCRGCEEHLPPGRVIALCTGCEQHRKQRLYAKPLRRCAQCGQREVKIHASRCQQCIHEEYEVRRWAIREIARPCVACGTLMPKGRRLSRCGPCYRKIQRANRKVRLALDVHRCAMCAQVLSLKQSTYCSGCLGMLQKWRKAWHEGNPIARQLGTVRSTRKWQKPHDAPDVAPMQAPAPHL